MAVYVIQPGLRLAARDFNTPGRFEFGDNRKASGQAVIFRLYVGNSNERGEIGRPLKLGAWAFQGIMQCHRLLLRYTQLTFDPAALEESALKLRETAHNECGNGFGRRPRRRRDRQSLFRYGKQKPTLAQTPKRRRAHSFAWEAQQIGDRARAHKDPSGRLALSGASKAP